MAERYTREDVERILERINVAAGELRLDGAGSWAVESMGGRYLYLTDRSRLPEGHTGPGERIEELGKGWHSAYLRLFTLRRDLLTVQLRQAKPARWRPASETERENWLAGYIGEKEYRETEHGLEVREG